MLKATGNTERAKKVRIRNKIRKKSNG